MKEVKHEDKVLKDGLDNPAFDNGNVVVNQATNGRHELEIDEPNKKKVPCLLDFFNPIVIFDCVKLLVRERPHNARRIVILILFLYFVALAPAYGYLYIY